MRYTSMTQLAKDALLIQDACNLSGVLLAWHEAQAFLRTLPVTAGENGRRKHPINLMFLSKVASMVGVDASGIGELTDVDGTDLFSKAYDWTKDAADGNTRCPHLINEDPDAKCSCDDDFSDDGYAARVADQHGRE